MKKTIDLLLPFFLSGLLSCHDGENKDEIETLQQTVDLLTIMNAEELLKYLKDCIDILEIDEFTELQCI